jgi:hypothetical protein
MHLPGHGVEVHAHREPLRRLQLQRQEVEQDRPVARGGERDELAADVLLEDVMEVDEAGGLPAEPWPVIDDLERDLLRSEVDRGQAPPPG